jgi:Glycine zipper 2TM domain
MRNMLIAASAIAMAGTAMTAPAMAQNPNREYNRDVAEANREYRDDVRDARREYRRDGDPREYNRDLRDAQRDRQGDVRDARRERRQAIRDWRQYRGVDYNRPDPYYGNYYAERYYRDGRYYRPYNLSRNDRVYRGGNGRYYCRRSDGTTGLVIGAVGGAALGGAIARGDSNLLGVIIGGGAGALLGREIERGSVRCR